MLIAPRFFWLHLLIFQGQTIWKLTHPKQNFFDLFENKLFIVLGAQKVVHYGNCQFQEVYNYISTIFDKLLITFLWRFVNSLVNFWSISERFIFLGQFFVNFWSIFGQFLFNFWSFLVILWSICVLIFVSFGQFLVDFC